MKKTIVAISAFLSSSIFAYGSGAIEPIYCPQEITCDFRANPNCKIKFISDSKYFSNLLQGNPWPQDVETLQFVSSTASFHSRSTVGSCNYKSKKYINYKFELSIKPESNVEAYYLSQNPFAWVFKGATATCESSKSTDCPLKEKLGFGIHNLNVTGGVIVKADNGIAISATNSNEYASINDEDALFGCGNVTQCTMDIMSSRSLKYGSIKIDMDTMK